MTFDQTNFTQIDWWIVAVYLLSSIVIGIWANRYVGNLSDYLVAGRTLRIRLALATMTGTELGLVTVMYSSELGFKQQYASLYLAVFEFLALLIVGLSGFVVYRLRQTEVMTIPEYYQRRYSTGVRVVGGVMMVMSGVLNMGLFLKAGAEFIAAISGLADEFYLKWIMTGLLALVLFYTVLGGMVSVVITDLIQFLVLGVGILIVTWFVVDEIGFRGFEQSVTHLNAYVDPTDPDNPSTSKPADGIGPITLLAQAVVLFIAIMLWPAGASRTLSVKSPEVAQKLYLFSTIPFLTRRALPVLWGLAAFIWFANHLDLKYQFEQAIAQDNSTVTSLSAMPFFLAKIIPSGLLGLVTAAMVAAFMSTHDSYLLCWSGVVTQDIVAPIFGPLSQRQRITITRIAIVVIGAALLFWGLWYEVQTDLWTYMAVTGTVYVAGVFPVVVGGLYWKRGSTVGAYLALLGGLTGLMAMQPVLQRVNALGHEIGFTFKLSNSHMMLFTILVSLVGYVLGSLLFPDGKKS